jgi:hypothetical protein
MPAMAPRNLHPPDGPPPPPPPLLQALLSLTKSSLAPNAQRHLAAIKERAALNAFVAQLAAAEAAAAAAAAAAAVTSAGDGEGGPGAEGAGAEMQAPPARYMPSYRLSACARLHVPMRALRS